MVILKVENASQLVKIQHTTQLIQKLFFVLCVVLMVLSEIMQLRSALSSVQQVMVTIQVVFVCILVECSLILLGITIQLQVIVSAWQFVPTLSTLRMKLEHVLTYVRVLLGCTMGIMVQSNV